VKTIYIYYTGNASNGQLVDHSCVPSCGTDSQILFWDNLKLSAGYISVEWEQGEELSFCYPNLL
jgi:hypothetical protein